MSNSGWDTARVEDQGIRGGDFLEEGGRRLSPSLEASDNPVRVTTFYGFRTFRPSRLPTVTL